MLPNPSRRYEIMPFAGPFVDLALRLAFGRAPLRIMSTPGLRVQARYPFAVAL